MIGNRKKSNKVEKIIVLGVILIMLFSLCSCKEKFAPDRVSVMVKAEFREKFEKKEFSVEDFEWDNVEKFMYEIWYDEFEKGWMVVYLKKHGKKHVLAAIAHFETLEFVEIAEPDYYQKMMK